MCGRNSGGRLFRCAPHVGEMSYSFDPQAVEQAGCPEAALEELEGFAACSALDTARKFRTCNKSSSVNCFAFDFNLARFFSWLFSSLATRFFSAFNAFCSAFSFAIPSRSGLCCGPASATEAFVPGPIFAAGGSSCDRLAGIALLASEALPSQLAGVDMVEVAVAQRLPMPRSQA